MTRPGSALVEVDNLSVRFPNAHGQVSVVDQVSFTIEPSRTLALVGESGSGKSVTSLALLGLIGERGGQVASGSVRFEGTELLELSERAWARIRGGRIGMIFQQPTRCLNPAFTVGSQVAEPLRRHRGLSRGAAWAEAIRMLDRVGITDAANRARLYPHQWSGGMCQRAMIAQALICGPDLLVADEPTTALDVTVQAKILDLLRDIQAETGIAILFITHDFGAVAEMADDVAVMYAGEVVESGSADLLLTEPQHPYTQALLSAVPSLGSRSLQAIDGQAPAPAARATGCRFAPRCPHAGDDCRSPIELRAPGGAAESHTVRCVLADRDEALQ